MSIDFSDVMKNKGAYLKEEEIDAMLQYCDDTYDVCQTASDKEKWLRNYCLIYTLYRTGRRITEVVGEPPYTKKVGFRPDDIRYDDLIEWDILKKDHIKTKNKAGLTRSEEAITKERLNKSPKRKLKPVDKEYLEYIKSYIDFMDIDPHLRILPITRSMADKIIKYVAKKCNIRRSDMKIHCHMFRHSFAINLLKKNPNDAATLSYLQDFLDHSDIKMTMTYAQFTQQDKKDMLDRTFAR